MDAMKLIMKALIWLLRNAKIEQYGNMATIDKKEKEQRELISKLKNIYGEEEK